MCVRLACGLKLQDVCNSCCYKDPRSNRFTSPVWINCYNSGKTYKTSYNVCPKDVAPVLLSGKLFKLGARVMAPMIFGVIPQWSNESSQKYNTTNCRIETIMSSKLYSNLLSKGQRCAVICNGFYEWQKQQNSSSKPYFLYGQQPDDVQVDDPETWNLNFTPEKGFSGFRPLKLAALFEMNYSHSSLKEKTLSFTIITKEADDGTSWLHSRIPAVLETNEQLDAWLNADSVNAVDALQCISHQGKFNWIPVSNLVNYVKNKEISCIRKANTSSKKKNLNKGLAGSLKAWLNKKQENSCEKTETSCEKTENISQPTKKRKL